MNDKELKKKIVDAANAEAIKDQYIQNVGQKAVVQRMDASGESIDQLKSCLADLGEALSERGIAPKGMKYVGSLSVHVFESQVLRQTCFVNLNNMKKLTFGQSDAACREMNQKVKEFFGMKRQKLRSGF